MLISQRFVVSKLKALGVVLPEQPSKVDDETLHTVLMYSGAHQRLISLARCQNITNCGVEKLPTCRSLLYLNLSYTQINDISALANCVSLRGVNLAGTNMLTYEPLTWLHGLEVLNLNCSSINSMGESFADLCLLRSLDIGACSNLCSLQDLQFLAKGQLTRLEELYLDNTPANGYDTTAESQTPQSLPPINNPARDSSNIENNSKAEDLAIKQSFLNFFDHLAMINCLRVVNIGKSPAAKYAKHLQSKLANEHTHVFVKPRSYYWFLSIINNDHKEVRWMILNGMDVNIRAGTSEMNLFFLAWNVRCKGKTPFFDCQCEDEKYRPNGIHVAVMFNSVESLKHLVRAEAKQDCSVWLGKVDVESQSDSEYSSDEELQEKSCLSEIDEEDLTSDDSDQDCDISLDSDDLLSLDSERSDYSTELEKKKENKRAWAREKHRKDREEKAAAKELRAAQAATFSNQPVVRRRITSLKPTPLKHAESGEKSIKEANGGEVSPNAAIFAKRVYDENVHRITEKMTERRITGWKLMSKTLMTRLQNILHRDPEEFDDDYQSIASVGSVAQVSVATEISKVKIVEEIKEEASKKKLYSLEDLKKMYSSKKVIIEEVTEPLLAKDDPDVTDDDLFLCNLRRDSNGDIVGTRGQFVSEEMIRLQLESAQSERASTVADGSMLSSVPNDSKASKGNDMFPELFAQGSGDEGKLDEKEDVSVITHDTFSGPAADKGAELLDGLVADEFFPHIPALEQCLPFEPLFGKLTKPVNIKVYLEDTDVHKTTEEADAVVDVIEPEVRKSKYAVKKAISSLGVEPKDCGPLKNDLGMEYTEVDILGKRSFWLESKRDLLQSRVKMDEEKQIEEEKYKLERWKNFLSESVKADGKVFGRDGRIAKPMKILYKNNGVDLSRAERKEKLAQLLKENREKYVL